MTKIRIIATVVALLVGSNNASARQTWKWANPTPTPIDVNTFFFIDSLHGWASAGTDELYRTEDGGTQWQRVIVPVSGTITEVFFIDKNTGWVLERDNLASDFKDDGASHVAIMYTEDRGVSWEVNKAPYRYVKGIFFVNKNCGWLGHSYRTIDGGKSWLPAWTPLKSFGAIKDLFYTDSLHGYVGFNFGQFFRTVDGGISWDSIAVPGKCCMNGIDFYGKKYGWGCKLDRIVTSTDSGKTWLLSDPISKEVDAEFVEISFIDSVNGWALNNNWSEQLVRTVNNSTWEKVIPFNGKGINLTGMKFVSKNKGWGGGGFGTTALFSTNDTGHNWSPWFVNTIQEQLTDIVLRENGKSWCTGSLGGIYHSEDSGQTWSKQLSGVSTLLSDIDFYSDQLGCIVGSDGVVLVTKNGGTLWSKNICGTKALSAVNIHRGSIRVAGESGSFYQSIDSGAHWQQIPQMPPLNYKQIKFISQNRGFAFGSDLHYAVTNDAGLNWFSDSARIGTPNVTNSGGWFVDCQFFDSLSGYILFDQCLVGTPDGGYNWTTIIWSRDNPYKYSSMKFNKIFFEDPDNGLILTDSMNLFRIEKGFKSWKKEIKGSFSQRFNAFAFNKKMDIGCIVGNLGAIGYLSSLKPDFPISTIPERYSGMSGSQIYYNHGLQKLILPHGLRTRGYMQFIDLKGAILNEVVIEGGDHSISIPLQKSTANGVYFARLSGDGRHQVIRIIQIK
jgi:photosystem II stability/assembly factor-like uncharacterized protein